MVKYGEIKETSGVHYMREVSQKELTSECWLVQMRGLEGCNTCEFVDTDECGGKRIRKYGANELGHKVPLGVAL